MDKYESFKAAVRTAAEKFAKINTKEKIRLVSHFDCDGICAASIMVRSLKKLGRSYNLTIVQSLSEEFIQELAKENFNTIIFTDIGSGQIELIDKYLGGKNVFVLDHHEFNAEPNWITHVNPHLQGIDGGQEISGAGVTYLFAKSLTDTEMSHLAIIGATGDVQDNPFHPLNLEILQDAQATGRIKVIKGLRIFGAQTRPLHKILEYSSDAYIPGVTGSESGALQFLQQIGIDPKRNGDWTKIVHLSDDEKKKLTAAIVMRRVEEKEPENILSDVYILKQEEKESPFRDVKEFSTLLNACGRMDKAEVGVSCCLDDDEGKTKALRTLTAYRREIVGALRWFESNKDSNLVHIENGYVIINAGSDIRHTVIGTLASILSKSNRFGDNTFILSLAKSPENFIKASLRISGTKNGRDLREIMQKIASTIPDAEAGGHVQAAGATVPIGKDQLFLEEAKAVLKSLV